LHLTAQPRQEETTMTMTAIAPEPAMELGIEQEPKPITKVSIIISRGTLEGVYPGLIMANGARMEGIEVNLFFTFFGMDAVRKQKQEKIEVATVGNPALGLPTLLGALPGMAGFVTRQMKKKMEQLDIPPIGEFVQMIADSGGKLHACKASADMFDLKKEDFVAAVEGIITVGDFYEMAAGGQIIFT
jgi:peroxiredoxin family protein